MLPRGPVAHLRSLALLVAVLAGGLGLAAWGQTWARSVADCLGAWAEQERASQELDQRGRAVALRTDKKQCVVDKVIAGRMGLLEAAARFGELNHGPPAFYWVPYRESLPAKSDEERFCREVILAVKASLVYFDPCLSLVICAGLESELEDHLRRGPLRLPLQTPSGSTPLRVAATR
jgi:hypothetical protein